MTSAMDDDRFDGMYMNMAQQLGGIDPLLHGFFGFLRRKTDFFTGAASSTAAYDSVLKAFEKNKDRSEEDSREKNAKEKKRKAEEDSRKERLAAEKAKKQEEEDSRIVDITEEAGTEKAAEPAAAPAAATEKKDGDDDDDDTGKGMIPIGNGAILDKYRWTQQLADLQVTIPVPAGTKAKFLVVDISKTKLKVQVKGQDPIIDGELHKTVKLDDCFWSVEDNASEGNRLVTITLQKQNQMEWWNCVVEGDPIINTQKVEPENSKLSDLDGDTRQTVEKMMFDQRAKANGTPTADESSKQDMLKKFMEQHPEMDFSKAKMC